MTLVRQLFRDVELAHQRLHRGALRQRVLEQRLPVGGVLFQIGLELNGHLHPSLPFGRLVSQHRETEIHLIGCASAMSTRRGGL